MKILPPGANPHLANLPVYEPGKPIEEVARELGIPVHTILKLASNENPLGPSPKAVAAMQKAIRQTHLYPDGNGFYLREALAKKFKLTVESVVLGNGSNEIIELLGHAFLRAGDEIVVSERAFIVYEMVARLFGAKVVVAPEKNYCHDLEAMQACITARTKIVFITNPNNPTGTIVSQAEIARFMKRVPSRVIVGFDEAYCEFLPKPPDTVAYVKSGRNVVVMRTFSKIVGLAALRIGYGLTTPAIAGLLQKVRQPFNTNALAQAAALAALTDTAHIRRTRRVTAQGRAYLEAEFSKLGLEYVPSHANFILVRVGDGKKIFEALLRQGIIVRPMTLYKLPAWIRVTIGTMPQNRRFLDALKTEMRLR